MMTSFTNQLVVFVYYHRLLLQITINMFFIESETVNKHNTEILAKGKQIEKHFTTLANCFIH